LARFERGQINLGSAEARRHIAKEVAQALTENHIILSPQCKFTPPVV